MYSSMFSLNLKSTKSPLQPVLDALDSVILGKADQVRLALTCVLARGHLLVEDVPGVGKTTLVKTLARVLGLESKRVHFTNDLLPADILGTAVFDPHGRKFEFHPGPIFTQVLIADELNRGTPRTQSAFLQAMEEGRVSLDGVTRDLPKPFFVVATQNPREQIGTYPLPESQLDRFLMRIHMGFPSPEFEMELLKGHRKTDDQIQPLLTPAELISVQEQVDKVHASEQVVKYIQRLLQQSRQARADESGLSPRSGLSLLAASRAWAFLAGRDYILPEDVQNVAPWVINHRMRSASTPEKAREFVLSVPLE